MVKTATNIYDSYYNKNSKKPIIFFIIIFALISVVVVVVLSKKTKNTEDVFYYYAVHCGSVSASKSEEMCETVGNLGGAGVIYNHQNKLYVIAGIYLSFNDAKDVEKSIKQTFSEAGIVKISTKNLSKQTKNFINGNIVYKNYFYKTKEFIEQLYDISTDYDLSKISINDVYKQVLAYKNTIKNMESALSQDAEVCKIMYASNVVSQAYIDSFFNSAFVSANVRKYIKKLHVLLTLEFVNMCNML